MIGAGPPGGSTAAGAPCAAGLSGGVGGGGGGARATVFCCCGGRCRVWPAGRRTAGAHTCHRGAVRHLNPLQAVARAQPDDHAAGVCGCSGGDWAAPARWGDCGEVPPPAATAWPPTRRCLHCRDGGTRAEVRGHGNALPLMGLPLTERLHTWCDRALRWCSDRLYVAFSSPPTPRGAGTNVHGGCQQYLSRLIMRSHKTQCQPHSPAQRMQHRRACMCSCTRAPQSPSKWRYIRALGAPYNLTLTFAPRQSPHGNGSASQHGRDQPAPRVPL